MYKSLAASAVIDTSDMDVFTESLLNFWREHGHKMKVWSAAARIMFALPASSCAAERVFALYRAMFTKLQAAALSDGIQSTLRLRYNDRAVG